MLDPRLAPLYKQHPSDYESIWQVTGETLGPFEHPRQVAILRGRWADVLNYAATLDGFWGYGPGSLEELKVVDVYPSSVENRKQLLNEAEALKARLEQIRNML
jgi:hypothetical protein